MQFSHLTLCMVAKFGHKSFSLLLTKCQFYKKNAVRIPDFNAHSEPLFKQSDILKFDDNIVVINSPSNNLYIGCHSC